MRKAENLRVCERSAKLLLHVVQILYFLWRQGKTFLLVINLKVFNVLYRLWLVVDGEDVLVQPVIHSLQHRVVFGILGIYREIFLNTQNAVEIHVLCNLYGIRTPWCNHLTSWSDEISVKTLALLQLRVAVKPGEFVDFVLCELVISLSSYHALL